MIHRCRSSIGPASDLCAFAAAFAFVLWPLGDARAALEVGPGKAHATIEDAWAAATAQDTIRVYPREGGAAYQQVALLLRNKQNITISADTTSGARVVLDGEGYGYSGSFPIPRAMFQFDPGSDGSLVENFEIRNCHNDSYNGAGFRINQANRITIRNCHVHHCDMGIMSNGSVADNSASDQLVENSIFHDNGNDLHAGFNHNFYVGGTSIVIRGCDVFKATTGHNIKSRAHLTIVEGCYVHDSPNREFDFVDAAGNTDAAGSHALISGCTIVKADPTTGNKAVINFGQDGGNDHTGILHILSCTILTPYTSAVVDLSAPGAGVRIHNTIVAHPAGAASSQTLVGARDGASLANSSGSDLWVSAGFATPPHGAFQRVTVAAAGTVLPFEDESSGDYRLSTQVDGITDTAVAVADADLPDALRARPLLNFKAPVGWRERPVIVRLDIGAWEWGDELQQVLRSEGRNATPPSVPLSYTVDMLGRTVCSVAAGRHPPANTRAFGAYLHTGMSRNGSCVVVLLDHRPIY